jgi:hypothetical protein
MVKAKVEVVQWAMVIGRGVLLSMNNTIGFPLLRE